MYLSRKIQLFGTGLFSVLWLSGCYHAITYEYLMSHPKRLEAEANRCQVQQAQSSICDVVQHAAEDFTMLANKRIANPDIFGQEIMQAELQLANALQELNQLKHDTGHADMQKLALAEQVYQTQRQKVETLLAVVVATSPWGR